MKRVFPATSSMERPDHIAPHIFMLSVGDLLPPIVNSDRNPKQDKPLTPGDIDDLKAGGENPHVIKGGFGFPPSQSDLYKDKQGNIYVKPKGGNGPGEPTGLNINDF